MKVCSNCNSEEDKGFDHYLFDSSDIKRGFRPPAEIHRCAECGIAFDGQEYKALDDPEESEEEES